MAMAPYLLLGFLFAGILHVFFKKENVARLLGSKKIKSSLYASLIGIPLPLCSCGVIPTGVSIYKSGASKGSTVSFLISTPQTGVDSILATYSMLGLPFAILRPFVAFISGVIGGSLTNLIDNEAEKKPSDIFYAADSSSVKNPIGRMFHYAFVESIQDIAKWLIIGLMLAALISLLLPADFFQNYIKNDFLGMLIILFAAIPLYICATGSIPIAAVLLMKGISPGAALVFLMAGPATNAATITVLGKVIGRKALFGYLISIIGSSMVFGLIVDNFLPREWFTSLIMNHQHSGHGLPYWLELGSTILLAILIFNIYLKIIIKKYSKISSVKHLNIDQNTDIQIDGYQYIKVNGLDCQQCKANIENSIKSVIGIEWVEADIESSTVKIKGSGFDLDLVKEAIKDSGHAFLGMIDKINNKHMNEIKIFVKGMTCNHCKANVEKTIQSMEHVTSAIVDLDKSFVEIGGKDIDLNELKKRIEEIGYEYGGIIS